MTFVYKSLKRDDIRLLTIESSNEASLSCSLNVYSPDVVPEYDAVTYAWGEETEMAAIKCNTQSLWIRERLFRELKHLYRDRPSPHRPLWIDAICLDQGNAREKAVQVPRMGEIYKSASRTLIWLGESADDSDLAMEMITSLPEKMRTLDRDVVMQAVAQGKSLDLYGLPHQNSAAWQAIAALVVRRWFFRLWTLQETILSEHLVVLCGCKSMPWDAMVQFPEAVSRIGLTALLTRPEAGYGGELQQSYALIHQVDEMWKFARTAPQAMNLHLLLEFTSGREYTEPVDRLWALLGLLEPRARKEVDDAALVDYTPAAKANFNNSYLSVLKLQIRNRPWLALPLISIGCVHVKHPPFPSWHVNWRAQRLYPPISNRGNCAAGFPNNTQRIPRPIMRLMDQEILSVLGLNVDVVERVSSGLGDVWVSSLGDTPLSIGSSNVERCCEWMAECLEIAGVRSARDPELTQPRDLDPPVPSAGTPAAIKQLWTRYKDHISAMKLMLGFESADSDMEPMLFYCKGRRFFRTSAGWNGMGPREMQADDELCTFYGGRPLFVLRPQEILRRYSHVDSKFKLIGDAYVPGLMYGEAFQGRSCESMQRFLLV